MWWLIVGTAMGKPKESQQWRVVNDTVMGGRSSATVKVDADTTYFQGVVSKENNGGFASIRSLEGVDIGLYETVSFDIQGQDVPAEFIIWMNDANLYYAHPVTIGEVNRLHFSDFTPKSYGRVVSASSLLQVKTANTTYGLLVGGGYEGEFTLELGAFSWIERTESTVFPSDVRLNLRLALERAIQRGVPVYNAGGHGECAAIYQTTLENLLILSSDSLSVSEQEMIQVGLEQASTLNANEQAWAYRRVIDALLMGF